MTSAGSAGLGGALDAFLADATVDEYSALGLPAAPGTHREGRRGWSIGVVACLIGLVLAAALMQARADSPARTDQRDALLARIAAADSTTARLQSDVDAMEAEVRALEATIAGGTAAQPAESLLAAAAAAPASGPGVRVVVDDAPGAEPTSLNRVIDRDLQDIVNALWRQGATAVAVNGQRLTSQSAIRSAGAVILVDYRPIAPPYTVEAVGALEPAEGQPPSPLQRLLRLLNDEYGLRSTTTQSDVALPAGRVRTAPDQQEGGNQP